MISLTQSTAILLVIALFTLGCETDKSTSGDDGDNPGDDFVWQNGFPGTPQSTQPDNPPQTGDGDQTFLWKPVSENNGKLVVLVPARLSTEPVGKLIVNDSVQGRFSSIANGNRAHYRFDSPGSAFGKNIPVVLVKNGNRYEWIVPDGAQRYTKR